MTAPKPNLAYVRAYMTEPRQYPPHLQQDLTQLNSNTLAVLEWGESLEQQLTAARTQFERVRAELISARGAYAELAAQTTAQKIAELQQARAEAKAEIEYLQAQLAGTTANSASERSAVDRVQTLIDEARRHAGKNPKQPVFLLLENVQAALEGKDPA